MEIVWNPDVSDSKVLLGTVRLRRNDSNSAVSISAPHQILGEGRAFPGHLLTLPGRILSIKTLFLPPHKNKVNT